MIIIIIIIIINIWTYNQGAASPAGWVGRLVLRPEAQLGRALLVVLLLLIVIVVVANSSSK